jgi:rhodanese-related sulfurtransferase
LSPGDEETFVAAHLSGLVPYPDYYRYMGPINLRGVAPMPGLDIQSIDPANLPDLGDDIVIVDSRPATSFAHGHIPGSLGIELRNDFGVWVGWMVPFDSPLILVLDPDQDAHEAVRQLARIGFDRVLGVMSGLNGWRGPLETHRVAGAQEFADAVASGAQIVDTRAPSEWMTGTIDGSTLLYVPDIPDVAEDRLDRARPVWVACATGFRAGITASLLAARGFEPIVLANGGVPEVLKAMTEDD